MNFVFVSLQRINTDRESTSTSLAKELARHHKVLYVNPPIDRKTWFSASNDVYTKEHIQLIKEKRYGLQKASENLWILNTGKVIESINWIPFTSLFSLFNRINNKRFAGEIKEAATQLGFDSFILINDKDIFRSFYLKELLKPEWYIYLDRDYTLGISYWRKHGIKLEPELMRKSDAVICNSYDFTESAKRYNPNSFYIGNGVDNKLFDGSIRYPVPDELRNILGPVVGYVGALYSIRLDLELIVKLVSGRSDLSFVFIGPEDDVFMNSKLHSLPNAFFPGKIHKDKIPSYVQHFNVCINPQIVNEITIGNFPLKIVEYLSMGKPVVAIKTNTMTELFKEQTYLAEDLQEFSEAITKAIEEDDAGKQQRRIEFSRNFSWEKVAGNVLNVIETLKQQRIQRQFLETGN